MFDPVPTQPFDPVPTQPFDPVPTQPVPATVRWFRPSPPGPIIKDQLL
jgi:hypothetical protein